ncbi:MAG: phosphatase PAP2 family protein [Oscillospiraceae bacterium]|nr:phosphatase PAP2 family protein [Oscillospiraceae bacterium]
MAVLYWLESIRNPVLDFIMQLFTHLGSEVLFLVIALTVFWCVDKREGIYLLFIGFIGTVINQFLKLVYRIPRPWVQDPNFTIVESARADAGGYSFPSGHTQNVVGTLGGIARWTKRKWLRIVCIVLLLLTSFSRMYLGVHTPLDVGVSFVLAAVLIFVLYPIVRKTADNPKLMYVLLGVLISIAFAFVLYANLTDFSMLGQEAAANVAEGRKNSYSLFGGMLGYLIAYPLDQKYIRFEEKAVWWVQILKTVLGLACVLAIKEGLKLVFNAVGFTWLGTNAIRYCAVVFFAAAIWPLAFPRLRRLSKKDAA